MNFNQVRNLLDEVFGPSSKFKMGDSVELLQGGELMVVIEIIPAREGKEPLIRCQWIDARTKCTRKELFPEGEIKLIDWYKAQG